MPAKGGGLAGGRANPQAMPDVTASRTLVKSAPELWTECSDPDALGRHLDGFGDIRITRLEPETAVAWEGEHASGTVRLEPSGWGTRVVLTATPAPSLPEVVPEPAVAEPEPEPIVAEDVEVAPPAPRPGFLARLFGRLRRAPVVVEPEAQPQPDAVEVPSAGEVPAPGGEDPDPQVALLAALDSLGQAHHRPYSRS